MSIDHDVSPVERTARRYEALARRSLTYEAETIPADHPHFQELRRLLTQDYLKDGTVLPSQLDENGLLPDHFQDNSVRFDVADKTKNDDKFLAGARLLLASRESGLDALQIHIEDLPAASRAMIEEKHQKDPGSVSEFATHLMAPGVSPFALVGLYRGMAAFSHDHGIKTWIGGLRPSIVEGYESSLPGVITRLGDEVRLGDLQKPFVPFAIDVEKLSQVLFVGKTLGEKAIESTLTPAA